MNEPLEIYRDVLPNMAQRFIDKAKNYPDKYDISITVNYGVIVEVTDKETKELVARYYSQDNDIKDPGKVFRFVHNGYEYMANSNSKNCYLAISKDWEPVVEQFLYDRKYHNKNVNYFFDDFRYIYSLFMESTVLPE